MDDIIIRAIGISNGLILLVTYRTFMICIGNLRRKKVRRVILVLTVPRYRRVE